MQKRRLSVLLILILVCSLCACKKESDTPDATTAGASEAGTLSGSGGNAAACALLAQDLPLTGSYVDEGLAIFSEEERLLELRRSFLRAGEEMEVEP